MDTEVSSALSTLELDPQNKDARAAISRHTETGDVDKVKLAAALRGRARLSRRAGQRRALPGADRSRAGRHHRQAGARRSAGGEGPAAVPRVRPGRPGRRMPARGARPGARATPPPASCCAGCRTRRRSGRRPLRPGSNTARTGGAGRRPPPTTRWRASSICKYRPDSKEGETLLARALEIDPRQKRAELLLERLLPGGRPHRGPGRRSTSGGWPPP